MFGFSDIGKITLTINAIDANELGLNRIFEFGESLLVGLEIIFKSYYTFNYQYNFASIV